MCWSNWEKGEARVNQWRGVIITGERQRQKNLGSRVALLPGKFLRVRKVFARITEKYLVNCPNTVGHPDINLLFEVPLGVHLADILDLQLQCPDLSERASKLCCVLMSTPDNQQPKPG